MFRVCDSYSVTVLSLFFFVLQEIKRNEKKRRRPGSFNHKQRDLHTTNPLRGMQYRRCTELSNGLYFRQPTHTCWWRHRLFAIFVTSSIPNWLWFDLKFSRRWHMMENFSSIKKPQFPGQQKIGSHTDRQKKHTNSSFTCCAWKEMNARRLSFLQVEENQTVDQSK